MGSKDEAVAVAIIAKKKSLGLYRPHPEVPHVLEAMQFKILKADYLLKKGWKGTRTERTARMDLDKDGASMAELGFSTPTKHDDGEPAAASAAGGLAVDPRPQVPAPGAPPPPPLTEKDVSNWK